MPPTVILCTSSNELVFGIRGSSIILLHYPSENKSCNCISGPSFATTASDDILYKQTVYCPFFCVRFVEYYIFLVFIMRQAMKLPWNWRRRSNSF